MTKENQDFTMYSGDTKQITFTVTMESGEVLTGATIKWVIKDGNTEKVSKDTNDGITITSDSTFRVGLDPSDTASLYGIYSHEAQVTSQTGKVATVARGLVTIENDLISG